MKLSASTCPVTSYSQLESCWRGPTYVLERVDALGGLLDLASNNLRNELVGQGLESAAAGLTGDDLGHLLADGADLGGGGVGGLLDLVGTALGECDDEQAEEVVVGSLDGDVALDQGLPLADKRSQLVGSEVEAVEVGQAVLTLNLVDSELDLAERVVLILLQIGQGNLDDAALQRVVGVLETGGPVDQSLADTINRSKFVRFHFSSFVVVFAVRGVSVLLTLGSGRVQEPVYPCVSRAVLVRL